MEPENETYSHPTAEELKLTRTIQSLKGLTKLELLEAVTNNPEIARDVMAHFIGIAEEATDGRHDWKVMYKRLLKEYTSLMDEHNDLLDLNAHLCLENYQAPYYETYESDGESIDAELDKTDVTVSALMSVAATPESTAKSRYTPASSSPTPNQKDIPKPNFKSKRSMSNSSDTSIKLDSKLVAIPAKAKSKSSSKSKSASTPPKPKLKAVSDGVDIPQTQAKIETKSEKAKKHHCHLTIEELIAIRPNATERERKRFETAKKGENPRFEVTHEEFVLIMKNRELAGGKSMKRAKKEPIAKTEKTALKKKRSGDVAVLDDAEMGEGVDQGAQRGMKKRKLAKE